MSSHVAKKRVGLKDHELTVLHLSITSLAASTFDLNYEHSEPAKVCESFWDLFI